MDILRNDKERKQYVQDKLKALYSELLDCEKQYAIDYVNWCLDKIVENKKHLKELELNQEINKLKGKSDQVSFKHLLELKQRRRKLLPKDYPSSLKKGDIIHVNYGVGYCGELSDGHYGIILCRRGSSYLVAPLSSTVQNDGDDTVSISGLNLPGESKETGYVVFNQIRFVHFRRIKNIRGIPGGRKCIDGQVVDNILKSFNNIIKNNEK